CRVFRAVSYITERGFTIWAARFDLPSPTPVRKRAGISCRSSPRRKLVCGSPSLLFQLSSIPLEGFPTVLCRLADLFRPMRLLSYHHHRPSRFPTRGHRSVYICWAPQRKAGFLETQGHEKTTLRTRAWPDLLQGQELLIQHN